MPKVDPLAVSSSDAYLGFDFGNTKIGVAVGQLLTATTSPLTTLRSVKQQPDWPGIGSLVSQWQPAGLVVGISKKSDGTDNVITPFMLKFCRQLESRFGLPVHRQDETLSTFEAKHLLFEEMGVRAGKLWEVQDQLAAQLILQSWINNRNRPDL